MSYRYDKPENFFQTRAVIGSGDSARHFLAYPADQKETFVIPGHKIIGEQEMTFRDIPGVHTVRVFDTEPKLINTAQLKAMAKEMGAPLRIDERYPVARAKRDF